MFYTKPVFIICPPFLIKLQA